jgi:hypothetical protein
MYAQTKGGPIQRKMVPMDAGLPTPTFAIGGWETKKKSQVKSKMNFDPDTVMKALQKNNDE